ncbi:dehydrogenase E1 and transketolase domain-containing protein 1 [Trametes versicolor FP-101664 SS1]|uniref:dehydrogenase E1 and transketolase domain-containing protein 1 n=1 Tax=Trametes versicolor (strain FP-101664) TaxID=717944 RepID=UPI0004624457|nr:dehydrogenase E1 and transketolase domain-containing protein 1 [Trametes versicolor FP-101664 SS1]EIW54703.1 dehydrogenase E1 and transketolase domain-containing protein 1 [Trametes versicolor FP-101664 SS1]
MSNVRVPSYLLTAPRTRRPTLSTKLRRSYYDYSYGYREPRAFNLPDYTPAQLHNRTVNAPLLRYVDSLRTHGHRAARVDPLDLLQREEVAALDPARYGLDDPARTYDINGIIWTHPIGEDAGAEHWPLERIARHLREVYVGRVAYEYMHSPSKTERLWFSHLLESESEEARRVGAEQRKRIHKLLAQSEVFDQFLQLKFPNLKRYGLEGGESMLPALDALFGGAAEAGVEHIVVGMPHRGRLNLLTGLLELPPSALFHKIKGGSELPEEYTVAGDVISHLTASPGLEYPGARKPVKVSLLPNPSHLEAVNPVALGKTRAKQFALLKALERAGETECKPGDRVMCVQMHGDASFTGQGVVMEGLGLSNLPHYTVGGSVHLVVNNSIGYTTPASSARSSLYCSDVAKMINAPVLHVNGDYPEDVQRAIEVAFKYRNFFRKDIIVDLIVYRRWGHNELDEPAFTQPLMYEKIRSRRSVPALYEERLIDENVLTKDAAESVRTQHKEFLTSELAAAGSHQPGSALSIRQGQWKGIAWPASKEAVWDPETGVDGVTLKRVGRASVSVPEGFEIHPRLQRHVKSRLQAMETGRGLDWATAEALAFGSLMLEGYDVRISGQDVGRGTFSQRHAMLVDQRTEGVVVPLNLALDNGGRLELANSSLSEMAVLGFEYGVSWEKPDILPIWEAQFGDFFNGAQVIIDTFLSSAETKWLKQSGLVLLLPHGLDGAGPEHSSSRIERMLQLTNDQYTFDTGAEPSNVNMNIAFPTTPAQYFHLLRRQVKRNFRKPLVVAGPKGLLRLAAAASSLEDLSSGSRFRPVIEDPAIEDPSAVTRVVCLTGKLYYDLVKERQKRQLEGKVALVRVEELSPFPFRPMADVLGRYDGAKEIVWLQEEPRNQGAWTHVEPRLNAVLERLGRSKVTYHGRKEDAVPAPGIASAYGSQQRAVIDGAFAGLQ